MEEESLIGNFIASDMIDEKTGQIFYEAGFEIDEDFLSFINRSEISKMELLKVDNVEIGSYIRNTLQLDKARSREEALFELFKIPCKTQSKNIKLTTFPISSALWQLVRRVSLS